MISLVTTTAAASPNTLSNAKVARTIEAVDTAENGANATVEESSHVALDGNVDFQKARDGKITYREYSNGQLTKEVDDADTTSLSPPTGFSHTGTPAPLETEYAYDDQGRRTLTTLPDGRVTQQYYTILKDRRRVTLSFTKYVSGTGDRYGPVGYTVTNHAGKVEASGVIALTSNESNSALTGYIDETDADPISAVDVGHGRAAARQPLRRHGHARGRRARVLRDPLEPARHRRHPLRRDALRLRRHGSPPPHEGGARHDHAQRVRHARQPDRALGRHERQRLRRRREQRYRQHGQGR
jgi:hypothetical protein